MFSSSTEIFINHVSTLLGVFDHVHLYCIYYSGRLYDNYFNINILWISMCLQMLDVYDKVSMFQFLVIYICMINRKTFQGFKAK